MKIEQYEFIKNQFLGEIRAYPDDLHKRRAYANHLVNFGYLSTDQKDTSKGYVIRESLRSALKEGISWRAAYRIDDKASRDHYAGFYSHFTMPWTCWRTHYPTIVNDPDNVIRSVTLLIPSLNTIRHHSMIDAVFNELCVSDIPINTEYTPHYHKNTLCKVLNIIFPGHCCYIEDNQVRYRPIKYKLLRG